MARKLGSIDRKKRKRRLRNKLFLLGSSIIAGSFLIKNKGIRKYLSNTKQIQETSPKTISPLNLGDGFTYKKGLTDLEDLVLRTDLSVRKQRIARDNLRKELNKVKSDIRAQVGDKDYLKAIKQVNSERIAHKRKAILAEMLNSKQFKRKYGKEADTIVEHISMGKPGVVIPPILGDPIRKPARGYSKITSKARRKARAKSAKILAYRAKQNQNKY